MNKLYNGFIFIVPDLFHILTLSQNNWSTNENLSNINVFNDGTYRNAGIRI